MSNFVSTIKYCYQWNHYSLKPFIPLPWWFGLSEVWLLVLSKDPKYACQWLAVKYASFIYTLPRIIIINTFSMSSYIDDGMVVPVCWGKNVSSNCISSSPSPSSTKGAETNFNLFPTSLISTHFTILIMITTKKRISISIVTFHYILIAKLASSLLSSALSN